MEKIKRVSLSHVLSTAARLIVLVATVFSLLPARNATQAALPAPQGAALGAVQQAATYPVKLRLLNARSLTQPERFDPTLPAVTEGQPIPADAEYHWLINLDNSGDPDPNQPLCYPATNPNYPIGCKWPSLASGKSHAPVVTQGAKVDLNETTAVNLPPGNYLISVVAHGYKLGGKHFTVPLSTPGNLVTVDLQPDPLPMSTIRVKVFWDVVTNGQFDSPAEDTYVLQGFRGTISDITGEVTTDMYGNPLCTIYQTDGSGKVILDTNGDPTVVTLGHGCFSDANGDLVIPNLGPNRYAVSVIPPDGTNWQINTTLEGNVDWDTWVLEGWNGFDLEFVTGGDAFPFVIAGFVKPCNNFANDPAKVCLPSQTPLAGNNTVRGSVLGVKNYVPYTGGLPYNGQLWTGLAGSKPDLPVSDPWVALTDLRRGDVTVYAAQGRADGTFEIFNVPDGDYMLTYWQKNMKYILDMKSFSVSGGQTLDLGQLFLSGWFMKLEGYVFRDLNQNGRKDIGEPGISNYPLAIKRRDNSVIDRGNLGAVTDNNGYYVMDIIYPLGVFMILEAYSDLYRVTGVTYQADNQPTPTTVLSSAVDLNFLPLFGLGGKVDWGVLPYASNENGGIVGTVFYDAVRNEFDARFSAVEPTSPGIPGLTVKLYEAVKDPVTGGFVIEADGSYKKGRQLNEQVTETWERPTNCVVRDVNGTPVTNLPVVPPAGPNAPCLEAPLMGVQFGADATLDGNYGFTTVWRYNAQGSLVRDAQGNPVEDPIPAGFYLVEVEVPNDAILGRPLYQFTSEESVNVYSGDHFIAPQVAPPPCVGPLHTVTVTNPDFLDAGGSPFEGQQKPLCNVKLVELKNGSSIAPSFLLYTEVPQPGRHFAYIINDLNLETNPARLFFGEKAGLSYVPVGFYDFTNRLFLMTSSDPNGVFEVLLPSTKSFNCPTPSGVCTGMFRLVGNDPGQPGAVTPNYNPQYRTISATFEVPPGNIIPADLAPTFNGVSITTPGAQFNALATCQVDPATYPKLFAVSRPYVSASKGYEITIYGNNFISRAPSQLVYLDDQAIKVSAWTDTTLTVTIPDTLTPGPYNLRINPNDMVENMLTIHVLGAGYNPTLYEVGPAPAYPYQTVQSAITAAEAAYNPANGALVVVYPSTTSLFNPRGVYYENVIISRPIKLQGVGPGGMVGNTYTPGAILSGLGLQGDTPQAAAWLAYISGLTFVGDQNIYEGPVVTVLARTTTEYTEAIAVSPDLHASIDGFSIEGGNQMGNINTVIQGGGIYVNGFAQNLMISNNLIQSNGGSYAGGIRVGTPNQFGTNPNGSRNDNLVIRNNRILANGGTNLAGAVGIFNGNPNYEIAYNVVCGNFSAEYGGGISHYGYSPNGKIHHNRVFFNRSYDEGGGIFVAGELPANPVIQLSSSSGPVDIYANIIQSNLGNDDGGGVRLLMTAGEKDLQPLIRIFNNFIVNNISTHEGGGIALNDSPNVQVYNNTIMKNITTATALTSTGLPAPAGFSTNANSQLLQNRLPGNPVFSPPLLFNNIFSDNRAGSRSLGQISVTGIGLQGDPTPVNRWDLGVAGYNAKLTIYNSIIDSTPANSASVQMMDPSNKVGVDPLIWQPYNTSINVLPWRGNTNMIGLDIVAVDLPLTLMGDYHLNFLYSPAIDAGTLSVASVLAPDTDIDSQTRPYNLKVDIGADEVGLILNLYMPHILRFFGN